jgi:hypothetical protein
LQFSTCVACHSKSIWHMVMKLYRNVAQDAKLCNWSIACVLILLCESYCPWISKNAFLNLCCVYLKKYLTSSHETLQKCCSAYGFFPVLLVIALDLVYIIDLFMQSSKSIWLVVLKVYKKCWSDVCYAPLGLLVDLFIICRVFVINSVKDFQFSTCVRCSPKNLA